MTCQGQRRPRAEDAESRPARSPKMPGVCVWAYWFVRGSGVLEVSAGLIVPTDLGV